ncbi:TFIID-18kDa-domain-containing protein [Melanomma pulvis-pyrius CBS 109.77]|uniref:TFIID-18kDa-domain-containing protein n=1 Tax=Melanomma pulvis-pyrius CBS 109.77 TaxID=1314802 RepID=A0A6A6X2R0_9PLEO|nr:TFIID-18kDa-domain-containing protein [Melanomma pulvis-pyrius CBS 109.77]
MADKNASFHVEITQMLFIAGETTEPSAATTFLIERIVHQQVVETLKRASVLATRRGTRYITNEDIIFIVRHDAAKVSRLRTFLAWKDVRKNLKDDDDKANPGDIPTDNIAGADGGQAVDEATTTTVAGAGAKKSKKKSALPWDVSSFFSIQPPDLGNEDEDEDEDDMNDETRRRLHINDQRTLNMTREQYAVWAECRQASFTWRKSKRFKEWVGLADVHDGGRLGDDVIDILGFLTAEMVQKLGEGARRVLNEEDVAVDEGKGKVERRGNAGCALFSTAEEVRRPIDERHVQEAFRKLQAPSQKARAFASLRPSGVPAIAKLNLI